MATSRSRRTGMAGPVCETGCRQQPCRRGPAGATASVTQSRSTAGLTLCGLLRVEGQAVDPAVPRLDELDAESPVLAVGVDVPGYRRRGEVVEREEEPDGREVTVDEVLQQEEVHVAVEVLEQREEVAVAPKGLAERAVLGAVVPTDALEREVEAVGDLVGHASGTVDRRLAIYLVAREDDHPADGVADRREGLDLVGNELIDHRPHALPPVEGRDDRVARQEELAEFRAMVQVLASGCDVEFEGRSVREWLAPERLVVATQGRAVRVRVPVACVSSEVERGVQRQLHGRDHGCLLYTSPSPRD